MSGTVRGKPFGSVVLQASADFRQPSAWADLATIGLDASGNGVFTAIEDPRSVGAEADYFRLRLP